MSDNIEIRRKQEKDYRFAIDFGAGVPMVYGDGPTPVQLLAAVVGNCLSDSLYFALQKFKQDPQGIETVVKASVGQGIPIAVAVFDGAGVKVK